ncbi:hypothetical protein G9A89_000141 [Geosiphon pyriformis]|nr:hypothetical protein G9A89_000141 [Geosiphon pyriformis]
MNTIFKEDNASIHKWKACEINMILKLKYVERMFTASNGIQLKTILQFIGSMPKRVKEVIKRKAMRPFYRARVDPGVAMRVGLVDGATLIPECKVCAGTDAALSTCLGTSSVSELKNLPEETILNCFCKQTIINGYARACSWANVLELNKKQAGLLNMNRLKLLRYLVCSLVDALSSIVTRLLVFAIFSLQIPSKFAKFITREEL